MRASIMIIRRARALGRDHGRAERPLRGAAAAELGAVDGAQAAAQDVGGAARAGRLGSDGGGAEAALGVVAGERRADLQAAARDHAETGLRSDAGPVHEAVLALLTGGIEVSCLRDPTRGGLASALGEVAQRGGHGVRIDGAKVPVRVEVADVCELLGLDPLRVACEGRFVAWVPAAQAEQAAAILRAHGCEAAAVIGEIVEAHPGVVILHDEAGGERILDMIAGEQLPRIC